MKYAVSRYSDTPLYTWQNYAAPWPVHTPVISKDARVTDNEVTNSSNVKLRNLSTPELWRPPKYEREDDGL